MALFSLIQIVTYRGHKVNKLNAFSSCLYWKSMAKCGTLRSGIWGIADSEKAYICIL